MSQTTKNKLMDPHGIFLLLKGDSGGGKSTASLSFPKPYVFDFDFKMPSISLKHFPNKEVHWDTFNNIFEIDQMLSQLEADCPYETLIADSITGLVNICMNSVGEVKGETVPSILKKVKGGAIEMMGIDYYSTEDRFCTYFVDRLKYFWARPGNPKHVILTAHLVTVESSPDLKTKMVTRTRSIVSKGKKFAAYLPTGFDNVYVIGHENPDLDSIKQQVKRICITESFEEDSAKCSFNFPSKIDFTNDSLYDKFLQYNDLGSKFKEEYPEIIETKAIEGGTL